MDQLLDVNYDKQKREIICQSKKISCGVRHRGEDDSKKLNQRQPYLGEQNYGSSRGSDSKLVKVIHYL